MALKDWGVSWLTASLEISVCWSVAFDSMAFLSYLLVSSMSSESSLSGELPQYISNSDKRSSICTSGHCSTWAIWQLVYKHLVKGLLITDTEVVPGASKDAMCFPVIRACSMPYVESGESGS